MPDIIALKNRVRAAIKANNNQEITGPVLQECLLDIIDELNENTGEETSRAQGAEANLGQRILEGDSTLLGRINSETSRAQEAENSLSQGISNESQARSNGDNTLLGKINSETSRAQEAENSLSQEISNESQARSDGDSTLLGKINSETSRAQEAEDNLSQRINTLNTLINAGYLYAGIATPVTVPSSTSAKIFYIAVEGGTYTSFGNINVTQGINIIYKSGNAWSVAQVVGIDNELIAGSDNLVKSGGIIRLLSPYIDYVTYNVGSGGVLVTYFITSGNSYSIKNNFGNAAIVVTRATPDGEGIDRVDLSTGAEISFTATGNASYLYIYSQTSGSIDVRSLSTGSNLLNAIKDNTLTGTYTSGNINQKTVSGLYKGPAGNILLVRENAGVIWQNEMITSTDGTYMYIRHRKYANSAWTDWIVDYMGSNNNYAILYSPTSASMPNVTANSITIYGGSRFVWNGGYVTAESLVDYDATAGSLTLDVSRATVGATIYKGILNPTSRKVSILPLADSYDAYHNILLFVGTNTDKIWCSLNGKVDGVSKYNNTSEVAEVFHTGIMPNYNTIDNTIEFSSFTCFITPSGRYRVNDMAGFSDDKLAVDVSSTPSFKLLLDKNSNSLVVASVADNAYDPADYALIMTGRTNNRYFSIPVAIDGLGAPQQIEQLYNNSYGESDNINQVECTNVDMIWTWWSWPSAVVSHISNERLFFGYTDASGHVGICEYDPAREAYIKHNLRKNDYVDDHNSSAVYEDADGKLYFFSDGLHGKYRNFHYRIAKGIENPSNFGGDALYNIGGQCVYTQVHKIGSRWYVFSRKNAMSWIYVSTEDFVTWTEPKVVVYADVQWYCIFKPVVGNDTLLRFVSYSNPTAGDSSIRLAYIDLDDDSIYDADGVTLLGTAGTGVNKEDMSVIIPATSPKKIRLQDLAITAMDDVVVSYYDMESYDGVAQYKVYRNGTIINTAVSDRAIGFSYHGGQIFVGDNKDKIVLSRYDSESDYDIIETYHYSNGQYIFSHEYHRTKVDGVPPQAGARNIREGRPKTDTSGKYIITHIGYLKYKSAEGEAPNYTVFATDAAVYKIID